LNVAITRARRRMTVVSMFTHHDMDPQRRGGTGMLREYLQYARSDGRSFGDGRPTNVATNGFEADIAQALADAGVPVVPQWGASKYRIDLVARHPIRPGQFVLAIECDGASYHAAPTARDRDRLRQQHLEALGWRFHRIWSTDWFQHRDQEIARAKAAYDAAVKAVDEPRPKPAPATLDAVAALTPGARVRRGPRPAVLARQPIETYATYELDSLLEWISSDGRLRTDDELVDELFRELGYGRRGARIMERLGQIVRDQIPAFPTLSSRRHYLGK